MTSFSTPYPGFEYQEFYRRRQQQSSVFLTPSIFSWYQQVLQKHRVYFDLRDAVVLGVWSQKVMAHARGDALFLGQLCASAVAPGVHRPTAAGLA